MLSNHCSSASTFTIASRVPRMVRSCSRLLIVFALLWGFGPLQLLGGSVPVVFAAGNLTVHLYSDLNRNGANDDVAPLSGITVAVYNSDNIIQGLVNTNASGDAVFAALPDGTYRVEAYSNDLGLPNGFVISIPGAAHNALVSFVTISGAGVVHNVGLRSLNSSAVDTGAGVVSGTRTIVSRVWDDENANGVQDATEPSIAGVQAQLLNSEGALIG